MDQFRKSSSLIYFLNVIGLYSRDIVDESGAKLGGKRASIQYAYETVETVEVLFFFAFIFSINSKGCPFYEIYKRA